MFMGYSYTPDYYSEDEDERHAVGIVIGEVKLTGPYITNAWLYRVYWFKTKRITETVAGHLQMVYNRCHDK